jgi:hypothetical protein
MRNPQNYKKYYQSWNSLRYDIINSIRNMLLLLETKSIAFADPFLSTCTLQIVDEDKPLVAHGITLNGDTSITVHGGLYDTDTKFDIQDLDMSRLLRLYKVFEEAYYEYPHTPFNP